MKNRLMSRCGTFQKCSDFGSLIANGGEADIRSDRSDFAF
jgi:hypothetical protein